MVDALGWRMKFGVVAPSTNTAVQPEFDAMRPRGITNHFARSPSVIRNASSAISNAPWR